MSFDVADLLGFAGGVLSAYLLYLGTKVKVKSDKEASLPDGWENLTGAMQDFFEAQLEERDRAIAEDRVRIAELEARDEERGEYLGWVTQIMRGIESWAAREGLTLPPPRVSDGLCVRDSPHTKEMNQNDYRGTTKPRRLRKDQSDRGKAAGQS
ncbi:hypothetical protein [Corynebacterium suedekumii]|uniref:Secreted protein n=1 Tax=Corynebacterium suedekumii TaxID=3049801 RepID=A0ABY8VKP2_9CORY|nr:hypothetical protein [Corynebacterium suedekumii]WIM69233.1 hypothetical protein QP029_08040 [Corynebacterium suedekumii]